MEEKIYQIIDENNNDVPPLRINKKKSPIISIFSLLATVSCVLFIVFISFNNGISKGNDIVEEIDGSNGMIYNSFPDIDNASFEEICSDSISNIQSFSTLE